MVDPLAALIIAVMVVGLLYILLKPGSGIVSRWIALRKISARVLREDALKHILKLNLAGDKPNLRSLAGALGISMDQTAGVVDDLEKHALVRIQSGNWELTETGREIAVQIVRAHRLYERYLAEETGYQEGEWHLKAESQEHSLTLEEIKTIERALGFPSHDPHGDPIPTSQGAIIPHQGISLVDLPLLQPARIVHIPDEPERVAAEVAQAGLLPGMVIEVLESNAGGLQIQRNGERILLSAMVASGFAVLPIQPEISAPAGNVPLNQLEIGKKAKVAAISPRCRGQERRRLMDLGILPGTEITAELSSPGGDPIAYRIRDTLIALRGEQASLIQINLMESQNG
ncbi:MAG: metal-dependent transcriptional regulator [Anaerolineae bacterium]|nr:metal-dependent transcriptional regulator [Anaerolineae bacterium]